MAAIVVVSGFAIKQKMDQRKQRKRDKKAYDEVRFKDLQKQARKRNSAPGLQVAEANSPEEERVARFLDDTFPWEQQAQKNGNQRSRSRSFRSIDEEASTHQPAGSERFRRDLGEPGTDGIKARGVSRERLIDIDT
ncbi:hypothetical protein K431DRAFT_147424 [Polychaeton citri CBS 116435]|uniref:Uncharacterized protein n=1 Tax=Polychaeton citri CBS 116435 TaxID=1314669 RepID=A0A9P4PZP7_9PEZI|nr:hypothetical protein K431DRAFT_147424 [Polychaeton citri CBS 116435]